MRCDLTYKDGAELLLRGPDWIARIQEYRVEHPRSKVPRGFRGLIVEQRQSTRVFCTVSRRSPEADAIEKLIESDMFSAPFFLITTWPLARLMRTRPGVWRVKGGGPTRTYRTQKLAQRVATARGRGSSKHTLHLVEVTSDPGHEHERPMVVEFVASEPSNTGRAEIEVYERPDGSRYRQAHYT